MGLKLEQVVPWGRSLAEYTRMFDLSQTDLTLRILDCGGGPASFNSEMTCQGYLVTSCDPIYQFSTREISDRIKETYAIILQQLETSQHCYIWNEILSPQHLGQVRMAAMQQFLADFPLGQQQGRYLTYELPKLPFDTGQFDLALCSHLLFTYSDHLPLTFHLDAIREMCRVAAEVRLFPLLNISGEPSPFLPTIFEELTAQGYTLQIKQVPYEFQKGGNQLLQVNLKEIQKAKTQLNIRSSPK